jgi:hypothetical protein
MDVGAVVERVERIADVRADRAPAAELISSGLVALREVEAWCAAQHAGLVAQLRAVDAFPEKRIADAAKGSLGQASKATERSDHAGERPRSWRMRWRTGRSRPGTSTPSPAAPSR